MLQLFCRLFTTCEFLCLLRGVNKLSVFHIKWFFSVNQYLTGQCFLQDPSRCVSSSLLWIFFWCLASKRVVHPFGGLSNINLSKMKIHYNRFWNKLCSLTLLKLSRWPKTIVESSASLPPEIPAAEDVGYRKRDVKL